MSNLVRMTKPVMQQENKVQKIEWESLFHSAESFPDDSESESSVLPSSSHAASGGSTIRLSFSTSYDMTSGKGDDCVNDGDECVRLRILTILGEIICLAKASAWLFNFSLSTQNSADVHSSHHRVDFPR